MTLLSGEFAKWQDWPQTWAQAFLDRQQGGAHERLGAQHQTLGMDKRLVTQCRQVIVYSLASAGGKNKEFADASRHVYDFMVANHTGDIPGSYYFSVKPDGAPSDTKLDLYGIAFSLLASAARFKASGDQAVLDRAAQTLAFIDTHFRHESGVGFHEALDKNGKPLEDIRRQNPHMHLFEACSYMYEASGDENYRRMADELLDLFKNNIFDHDKGVVIEFFDDNMQPHADKGAHVEAGHIAEWVWLLERYKEAFRVEDAEIGTMQGKLFDWIGVHGFDQDHGGIFNAQTPEGAPVDEQKRIWPLFETLRAASIMRGVPEHSEFAQEALDHIESVLTANYIRQDGWWTEINNRDFTPATDYNPGTTPYHIYGPLIEASAYLKKNDLTLAASGRKNSPHPTL